MYCQKAREFAEAANFETGIPNVPTLMTEKEVNFVTDMVYDELQELKDAKTIQEQADALVDAIYYICQSACVFGINLDPVYEIVHKHNMMKVQDGKVKRHPESNKVLKPKDWVDPKPFVQQELELQLVAGSFKKY